jgi:uncharacterized protein
MAINETGPRRTCISCRETADKKSLVRYVLDPEKQVLIDYRQRLPGRGVYTCFNLSCIEMAVKRQGFKRAFKQECCPVDTDALNKQLKLEVEQKILNLIGMARKAGEIISGTNSVIDLLKKPQSPSLVLVTDDISVSIGDKICQLAERKKIHHVRMFSKMKIGQLLGKDERSAIALEKGALASTLKFELQRFEQM